MIKKFPENILFEDAINELNTIAQSLENGYLPLDDMIVAFERGVYLKNICNDRLSAAKLRVEEIGADKSEG
jgi:exodeoxyribonuclease VII small subunit